ncbi:MAG: hypothetical protein ACOVOI_17905, partial [Hyphomicrobiales bacterium]
VDHAIAGRPDRPRRARRLVGHAGQGMKRTPSPPRVGFPATLARRAAAERRRIGIDPLEGLDRPPDWQSPDALPVAFREEARLYRFLAAGAQESGAERDHETLDLPSPQVFAALNHAEKALARRALRRLLRGPAPPTVSRFDLLGLFAHGLLGWRLLRRAGPDPAPDLTR